MPEGSAITTDVTKLNAKGLVDRSTFHLAAGLLSGFTSAILLQPADLLKTRIQQSRSDSLLRTLREITSSPQPIRQLWRGTLPSTIRTSVGSALYFTSLNALRTQLARHAAFVVPSAQTAAREHAHSSALPRLTGLANLGTGAVARASVGFIMMPVTVIKVRFESSYYAYPSLLSATRSIWRGEGLRGLFAGFGATALRDAPYAGLYVLFYEQGKSSLSSLLSVAASVNFVSGAAAAALATALTNPPDAIKTRIQLQPSKYRNTLQCARRMLREEGIRSMFDGLGLRMARKALSSALAWTVYEEFVRRAEGRWVTSR